MSQESFTIGSLARQAGVGVETIRFYQRRGLLAKPERLFNSVRRYTENHAQRLRFIKQAQKIGFSLDEIAELLRLADGQHCLEAKDIALRKLVLIRERIESLRAMEKILSELTECCSNNTGSVSCPIILTLQRLS